MRKQWTAFSIAVVVLTVAAITLKVVVDAMQLHFQKAPVALRKPLDSLPAQVGPWLQVSKDEPLDKELEDVLGTEKYIFRDYVDTRKLSATEIELLKSDPSTPEFRKTLVRIQTDVPDAFVSAAVTYYTGMVDTVAHIPDRCYIADGFEPKSFTSPVWDIGLKQPLQVRLINFEDQTPNRGSLPVNVAYFFQCNGSYESDPLDGVRFRLQNLSEKYGYYAKIELKSVMPDPNESARVMADYLRYALPLIEQCLPDWKAIESSDRTKTAVASAER